MFDPVELMSRHVDWHVRPLTCTVSIGQNDCQQYFTVVAAPQGNTMNLNYDREHTKYHTTEYNTIEKLRKLPKKITTTQTSTRGNLIQCITHV